jgi:hypothetical protein
MTESTTIWSADMYHSDGSEVYTVQPFLFSVDIRSSKYHNPPSCETLQRSSLPAELELFSNNKFQLEQILVHNLIFLRRKLFHIYWSEDKTTSEPASSPNLLALHVRFPIE